MAGIPQARKRPEKKQGDSRHVKRHCIIEGILTFSAAKLVSAIRDEIAGHPQALGVLGKVDRTKGRWWVDTSFPEGPPQDYAVRG
jgi:hypothetical protein